MHFTYTAELDTAELYQGDILARTPELDQVLRSVHPHFHQKDKNLYFMVLTQSCDLVLRHGGQCKAPYITIAPVRSVDSVLSKEIATLQLQIEAEAPVLTDKSKAKLTEFLGRLYNNNEPGYFFLEASDTELPEDCCTFLSLSIPVKAPDHYAKCLAAKRLQLSEAFQAKLGWLVAQMFSRVGTADWDSQQLKKKIAATLKDAGVWIPADKAAPLLEEYASRRAQAPAATMTARDIKRILDAVPSRKRRVVDRASVVIEQALQGREDAGRITSLVVKHLENDAGLTALLP